MSNTSDDAGRRVWQCPQCDRRFKIPIDAATPKLCRDCRKPQKANGWYYQIMGQEFGPVPTEQLMELAKDRALTPDCPVMYLEDGQDNGWVAAESVMGEVFSTSRPVESPQPDKPVKNSRNVGNPQKQMSKNVGWLWFGGIFLILTGLSCLANFPSLPAFPFLIAAGAILLPPVWSAIASKWPDVAQLGPLIRTAAVIIALVVVGMLADREQETKSTTTRGTAQPKRFEPEKIVEAAPPFSEIRENIKGMTDAQWNYYAKKLLPGKHVAWDGWIEDVKKKTFGGYRVSIDMDPPKAFSVTDVTFDVTEDVALSLRKDAYVSFTGRISSIKKSLISCQVKLKDANVTESQEPRRAEVQDSQVLRPSSRKPSIPTVPAAKPIPEDVTYTVIDKKTFGVQRSLTVRLNRKVSKGVLHAIAMNVKKSDPTTYEQTYITYYLSDMLVDTGAWAITDFLPVSDLKLRIWGLTVGQENAIKQQPQDSLREVIGSWLDDRPNAGTRWTIFRQDGKLFIEFYYSKSEAIELPSAKGQKFQKKEGPFGEFYLIDNQGNLQLWDEDGLIGIAKKIN